MNKINFFQELKSLNNLNLALSQMMQGLGLGCQACKGARAFEEGGNFKALLFEKIVGLAIAT